VPEAVNTAASRTHPKIGRRESITFTAHPGDAQVDVVVERVQSADFGQPRDFILAQLGDAQRQIVDAAEGTLGTARDADPGC